MHILGPGKREEEKWFPLKEMTQKLHISLLLRSHWAELSHMAIPKPRNLVWEKKKEGRKKKKLRV